MIRVVDISFYFVIDEYFLNEFYVSKYVIDLCVVICLMCIGYCVLIGVCVFFGGVKIMEGVYEYFFLVVKRFISFFC